MENTEEEKAVMRAASMSKEEKLNRAMFQLELEQGMYSSQGRMGRWMYAQSECNRKRREDVKNNKRVNRREKLENARGGDDRDGDRDVLRSISSLSRIGELS